MSFPLGKLPIGLFYFDIVNSQIRLHACLCFRVQPTETADHLTALRTEHAALVLQRTTLEDSYRVSTVEECGMEVEFVDAKIAKARSTPHQNKRLQAIHEAHRAVLSKEAEIKAAEEDDNEQDEVKNPRKHKYMCTRMHTTIHTRTYAKF